MDFEFWTPLEPPEPLRELLYRFLGWGSVVEHHLFAITGEADRGVHFQAAVSGLEAQYQWLREYHGYRGKMVSADMFNWDVIGMERGRPWNPQEFFGPYFDLNNGQRSMPWLAHRWKENRRLDQPISFDGVWTDAHEFEGYSNFTTRGYTQAVLNPPYSLSTRDKSAKALPLEVTAEGFLRLCNELFGDPNSIEVVNWPDDFSDYFKPGLEWWGAYFWTVWAPQKNWIVTILASATD